MQEEKNNVFKLKRKTQKQLDPFTNLTWDDLNEWAGSKIVTRGRSYQRQGRVSALAVTTDSALIAWVDGSERYATKVAMDEDVRAGEAWETNHD